MKRYLFRISLIVLVFSMRIPLGAQSLEREAFLDAEVRFMAGNYALALDRYDEFIRSWPDSAYAADARYRRAVTLYRLGRRDEAYTVFLSVEGRYRSTKYLPYVPFWKAVIEFEQGAHESAAGGFRRLVDRAPDDETLRQSLLYLGKTAAILGEDDEALYAFESLLHEYDKASLPPEQDASALVFLSDLYSRKNMPEKQLLLWERIESELLDRQSYEQLALRAAEAYLDVDRPGTAMTLFNQLSDSPRREIAAAALQHLLEYEQRRGNDAGVSSVIIKAENLLRSDPEALAEFWQRVGAGAFRDGQYDVARAYFLRISAVLASNTLPQDVPVYLAEIAYRQGDLDTAYRTLLEAEGRVQGEKALLMLRAGWYALLAGKVDDAERLLRNAVSAAVYEGNGELEQLAKSYLAHSLYRSGNNAEASTVLTQLSAVSGTELNPADLRLLAAVYAGTGRAEASLESYDQAIQADPGNPELQVERMALLFENTQYRRVLEDAARMEASGLHTRLGTEYYGAYYYVRGLSAAFSADYTSAIRFLNEALGHVSEDSAAWVRYYYGWSYYRSSRFGEAAAAFTAFLDKHPGHEQEYMAGYLGAWSYARMSEYRKAAEMAGRAAEKAAVSDSLNKAEAEAAARYLEASLRPFFNDYNGAIAALDKILAIRAPQLPQGRTTYTVRAAFEKGTVYQLAGRINDADNAYAAVSRNYPNDPLAADAAYRRAELMFSAERWEQALERFNAYRQQYPSGRFTDAALYYGGLSHRALNRSDAAILLWERVVRDFRSSRYHFPTMLLLGRAYWDKEDWESAFRTYTTALAEYGERARAAGLADEAETLRYLMAKLPEKAARLHVRLAKENGAASPAGRRTALELARFYITESAQREAGAALADDVAAFSGTDPAAASEAFFLKGEYYSILESWENAAASYMDAVSTAVPAPADARTVTGNSIRNDMVPEALFKAVRSYLRAGNTRAANDTSAMLNRLHPASPWTAQSRRLMEGAR